jgi:hypothetical protein
MAPGLSAALRRSCAAGRDAYHERSSHQWPFCAGKAASRDKCLGILLFIPQTMNQAKRWFHGDVLGGRQKELVQPAKKVKSEVSENNKMFDMPRASVREEQKEQCECLPTVKLSLENLSLLLSASKAGLIMNR